MKLPAATKIGQVHLQIANLEDGLKFYGQLLGFQTIRNVNGSAELSASGLLPSLIVLSELPNARPKPAHSTGLFHVAIRLPSRKELARLFRRLVEHRYPFSGFADHGVSEALYLSDPFGLGLELYRDRPRNEWPHENGKLKMYTEQLDVDRLLAEAEGDSTAWSGIHPDTDIGHVHLHVSDLAKAEEFYSTLIGFDVTERGYPGALFVSAGGYHHHVGLNIWAGRGAPPPPVNAVGLRSFRIAVPEKQTLQTIGDVMDQSNVLVRRNGELVVARDQDGLAVEIAYQT